MMKVFIWIGLILFLVQDVYNSSVGDPMRPVRGMFKSSEECLATLGSAAFPSDGGIYCNGTWDKVLCWKAAKAGTTVRMHCPPLPGLVPENYATRRCGPEGRWEGKKTGDYRNPRGYTNYTGCYTPQALEVYKSYMMGKTPAQKQIFRDIVTSARTMEIVGLSLSLIVTIVSLLIFTYFRNLKCHRTRIHKNLFVAIIVQISIMLIQYIDQYVARSIGGEVAGATSGRSGAIYDTPIFCEILYALLEYTKTVKFMWMFIEGLYLHNMIAVSVFSGKPNYTIFYAIGWGFPILLIIAWVIPLTQNHPVKCWYGYYYLPMIWIIEAPRVAVMAVNLLFLINIIRVLVMKLRQSHTNEANKVRKAVKAAIVLLPLLGITNFAVMIEPSRGNIVKFAVWAFTSHFLITFEGFFIALLYCFLNGEVQLALQRRFCRRNAMSASLDYSTVIWRAGSNKVRVTIRRHWQRYRQRRLIHTSSLRRMSRSLSIFTSYSEVSHTSVPQKQNQAAPSITANGHVQPLLRDTWSKRASSGVLNIRRAFFRDSDPQRSSNVTSIPVSEMNEQRI